MVLFQSDRPTAFVGPWLVGALLLLCLAPGVAAQVIDDFESGPFNVGGTVYDFHVQSGLLPIHCLADERFVEMTINGSLSDAVLTLTAVDNQVVMVWGNNGGSLAIDYDTPVTDLTFGSVYNALQVSLPVAVPAGELEIVLWDDSADEVSVSQSIIGDGDYIFPFVDFVGINFQKIDFIELNLLVPDFGDYHISDFRVTHNGVLAAAIDVTQDTSEGPPYPTEPLEVAVFYEDESGALVPIETLEISLHEVTNAEDPPATQMVAMDSGGGVGLPGAQAVITVADLGDVPPGHRTFDLHVHAASVGLTMAVLPGMPAITQPPTPIMPMSFGLGFTTYQHDSGGGLLRRVKHSLSFETPAESGLSFSNLRVMPGDPDVHPNSFHIFFDVETVGPAAPDKVFTAMYKIYLRGFVYDYATVSGVVPVTESVRLTANVPNPFNPGTMIRFSLPRALPVRLTLHDLAGREVRRLADGEIWAAGQNTVYWDGRDKTGRPVASGGYLVKLAAGDEQSLRKILLLK